MADRFKSAQPFTLRKATVTGAGNDPGANTDILSTDLTPDRTVSAYRITVSCDTGTVFNVMVDDGRSAGAVAYALNGGTALTAGALYTFVFGVTATDDGLKAGTACTYNFQVETDSEIHLLVDEVHGPVI